MELSDLELDLLQECDGSVDGLMEDLGEDYRRMDLEAAIQRLAEAGLLHLWREGELMPDAQTGDLVAIGVAWCQTTPAGRAAVAHAEAARIRAGMPALVRRPRIYLMTDYTSSSLWCERGGVIDLGSLPLMTETKAALEAWSERMWDSLDAMTGDGPPIDEEAYEAEMRAEGDRLWDVVRAELGDRYEVGRASFATGTKRIIWDPDAWPG